MSDFALPPKECKKQIIKCLLKGVVPMVTASPGVGKSAIMAQIADEYNLELVDLRLSQCAPEDLMGLPMRTKDKATFVPFSTFPIEGDPLPAGKEGWLLFLDEFNSAPKSVQAASYKVVLDRMVGQFALHENVLVAAAGNLDTDRAIVTEMSTAMQSRLVHLELQVSSPDWIDHAVKSDFDPRVIGFLSWQVDKLHQFDPDHNDKTFACPRTWEFVSKLIKGDPIEEVSLALLAGTISKGVAIEFYTFMKEYASLVKYDDVVKDPMGIAVPDSASTRYALMTMMMDSLKKGDFPQVVRFVKRFPPEFQVIFFRGTLARDPSIRRDQAFESNILDLTRFLNDDNATLAA